ncbi:MAG TPA: helix-turn-helix transcriptional regulator [Methylomirabilota bacterium]|jgi:plasmid maintenance system antidote protein VapI|nr:helix-turn-helix transcriptional regulator [Methylomirabilota bacterium]
MQQIAYDVAQMQHDMAAKGWQSTDLARKARVDRATVSRFFDGSFQTPRTAKKLATALGYSVRRYLRPLEATA